MRECDRSGSLERDCKLRRRVAQLPEAACERQRAESSDIVASKRRRARDASATADRTMSLPDAQVARESATSARKVALRRAQQALSLLRATFGLPESPSTALRGPRLSRLGRPPDFQLGARRRAQSWLCIRVERWRRPPSLLDAARSRIGPRRRRRLVARCSSAKQLPIGTCATVLCDPFSLARRRGTLQVS